MAVTASYEQSTSRVSDEHTNGFSTAENPLHHTTTAKTKAGIPVPVDYPQWIGHKFEPNGAVRPFAGNTIISHVPRNSEIYRCMTQIHHEISSGDFAGHFALLPPESFHMTILEGVCDAIRDREHWPRDLPLDAPLSDCTSLFYKKLAEFDAQTEPRFRVAVRGWTALEDGIGLDVVPVDKVEEARLFNLRDRLSDCLQLRLPNHVGYELHVSIGYSLRFHSKEDEERIMAFLNGWLQRIPHIFELDRVEFCTFTNMFAFHPAMLLENRGAES